MDLYLIIYEFLSQFFFPTDNFGEGTLVERTFVIGPNSDPIVLGDYLCNMLTIVIMILFFIALINLVLWCFKLGRHLLHL